MKNIKKYILLLFILIITWIFSSSAYASIFRVNSKKELNSAISQVKPGDTIQIANGTYTNWGHIIIPHTSDCTQSQPCTLTAETEGRVVFSGQGALNLELRSAWWTVSKLKWTGQSKFSSYSSPNGGVDGALITFDGAQDCTVDDVTIKNISGSGVVVPVMKYNGVRDTLRNTFQNSVVDGYTQTNAGSAFIYILAKSSRGFNKRFNILNNTFKNRTTSTTPKSQYWIRYGNSKLSINYNSFVVARGNLFANDTLNSHSHDSWHIKSKGWTIENNTFIKQSRLVFRGGKNHKIIGNKFINPITKSYVSHIFIYDSGHKIISNLFYTNNGSETAIVLGKGSTDANGDGIRDYEEFEGLIINNTFDGFIDESIQAARNANGDNDGKTTVNPTNIRFQNNVIRQDKGIMINGSSCKTLFSTISHNAYSGSANPGCMTRDSRAITSAPRWVNPADGDYNLKNTSPLINAGVYLSDFPETHTDIDGNQRDNSPDIGAYRFGAAIPPLPPVSLRVMTVSP